MGVSPNLGPIDEVVVLVREKSGRQHAWRVFDATATFLTGPLRGDRTTATITATGVFHRLSKAGAISDIINEGAIDAPHPTTATDPSGHHRHDEGTGLPALDAGDR